MERLPKRLPEEFLSSSFSIGNTAYGTFYISDKFTLFFKNSGSALAYKLPIAFFCVLFTLVIAMTPNLYLLLMKFKMKPMALLKASLAITIGKPIQTLGNAAAFFIVLIFFEIVSGTAFLFMGSIYAFIVVFMNKK